MPGQASRVGAFLLPSPPPHGPCQGSPCFQASLTDSGAAGFSPDSCWGRSTLGESLPRLHPLPLRHHRVLPSLPQVKPLLQGRLAINIRTCSFLPCPKPKAKPPNNPPQAPRSSLGALYLLSSIAKLLENINDPCCLHPLISIPPTTHSHWVSSSGVSLPELPL